MPRNKQVSSEEAMPKLPPATTPEGREQQIIAIAYDLAEKRIREGTASAQEVTHFLKAGQTRNQLEIKRLEVDIKLAEAKASQIGNEEQLAKLQAEAIRAFTGYQGGDVELLDEYDED